MWQDCVTQGQDSSSVKISIVGHEVIDTVKM